jgi:hypothetical protein
VRDHLRSAIQSRIAASTLTKGSSELPNVAVVAANRIISLVTSRARQGEQADDDEPLSSLRSSLNPDETVPTDISDTVLSSQRYGISL